MLMMELYVPETDEAFDFEAAEDAVVGEVIGKLQELLEKNENIRLQQKAYELYAVQKELLLPKDAMFGELELQSGEQLVWV